MQCWRLTHWNDIHEKNRTRGLVNMVWAAMPVKFGDGYCELVAEHEDGSAHYGVWCSLICVAAQCQPRGYLVRSGRGHGTESDNGKISNLRPHDAGSLARLTRHPVNLVRAAVDRLLTIGWLETCALFESSDSVNGAGSAVQGAGSAAADAGFRQSGAPIRHLQDKTGQDKTSAQRALTLTVEGIISAWNENAQRSNLRRFSGQVDRVHRRVADLAMAPGFCERWRESLTLCHRLPVCRGESASGHIWTLANWLAHWDEVLDGKYHDGWEDGGGDAVLDRLAGDADKPGRNESR